jgi:large-conductance mechanosensitive channel
MMGGSWMTKELKYVKFSDEDVVRETEKRLKEMKALLAEIRDLLKATGGLE